MYLPITLSYYKRPEIQQALVSHCIHKEVAVRFLSTFGKRPDILSYPEEVLDYAQRKATSFHCSEELWDDPLLLGEVPLEELRIGWDLVLDIDCKYFSYSKLAAYFIIKTLRSFGIKSVSCKFSGNKGFHIGVPFEAFPPVIGGKPIVSLFPEAPRRIAAYIKHLLTKPFANALLKLEKGDFHKIMKNTGLSFKEVVREEINEFGEKRLVLDGENIASIDTVLIAPRHLYRAPYSLHEKTWLVSLPIDPSKVLSFSREEAKPSNVSPNIVFLDRKNAVPGEASKLLLQAFDFTPDLEVDESVVVRSYDLPSEAVKEEFFPPCIKNILKGLKDGRKRSLFVLINFLRASGWKEPEIRSLIKDWNKRNFEPLRDSYVEGQLRYAFRKKEFFPPHNCRSFYEQLGVCSPDEFCSRIRNPVQYPYKAMRRYAPKKISKPSNSNNSGK